MNYTWTPLNSVAGSLILIQAFIAIVIYDALQADDAMGLVGIIATSLVAVMALLVDFALQLFLKNRWLLVRVEWVMSVFLVLITLKTYFV